MKLIISAFGHQNIEASHKSTWQLTTEKEITSRADCILGVNADYCVQTLPNWLKTKIQSGRELLISINANEYSFTGTAIGHPDLKLTDPIDMVFRKSSYISDRTIAINCSFAANDLPNELKTQLQNPETPIFIELS